MSKSAIYTVNTNAQTITAGSLINLGSIVRRYGGNINLTNSGIALTGCGYYDVNINVGLTGTSAGNVEVIAYKDGVAVPGASASVTVAENSEYSVSIPMLVRNTTCDSSVVTVGLSGTGATVSNIAITAEKE